MRPYFFATLIIAALGLTVGVALTLDTDASTPSANADPKAERTPAGRRKPRARTFLPQHRTDRGVAVELTPQDLGGPAQGARQPAADPNRDVVEEQAIARLDGETRDSAWSGAAEQEIYAAFEGPTFPGATVREADCRTTMCRVELSLADEQAFDSALEAIPTTPPFATNGVMRRKGTDDTPLLVLYVARDGHRVSDPS